MVYVFNVYLNHDKPRNIPTSSYQWYLDQQRRKRHREAFARPLYRERSIEREMDRQRELEHLRQIKREDIYLNRCLTDVINLDDRINKRCPSFR